MVVFQYGSAVFFNIGDHEVEVYLDIIRKHALGFLSEMKKDGKIVLIYIMNYDFRRTS